jgi:hypothetical protein
VTIATANAAMITANTIQTTGELPDDVCTVGGAEARRRVLPLGPARELGAPRSVAAAVVGDPCFVVVVVAVGFLVPAFFVPAVVVVDRGPVVVGPPFTDGAGCVWRTVGGGGVPCVDTRGALVGGAAIVVVVGGGKNDEMGL